MQYRNSVFEPRFPFSMENADLEALGPAVRQAALRAPPLSRDPPVALRAPCGPRILLTNRLRRQNSRPLRNHLVL